jgi:RNA polymerase-interacting CarD/CdnL/TRCF family regulator
MGSAYLGGIRMDYKMGDKVVYPNHGVGIIEQISYGMLDGRTEK